MAILLFCFYAQHVFSLLDLDVGEFDAPGVIRVGRSRLELAEAAARAGRLWPGGRGGGQGGNRGRRGRAGEYGAHHPGFDTPHNI